MAEPSIDEVARAAGVHRSTVSRAFSRPEAVKRETRDHILEVAAALGYTMSPLAQALRRKSSNLVPLVIPDITNPFFGELASTMTAAAEERGYQLVLCVTDGDERRTSTYLSAMQNLYAPFAIVAPSARIAPADLAESSLVRRMVVVDRFAESGTVPTVTVDSARGIELAFTHLRGLGHTSIAYVSGITGNYTATDRLAAYTRLAEASGMPAMHLGQGDSRGASGRAAAEYAGMSGRPTAIITANDMVAFGLISALGTYGVQVPRDVSVVGFDGLALGERFNPGLTTIRQPIADMGRIAIDLAERLVSDGVVGHVTLEPTLLVRRSTAAVPS